MLDKTSHKKLFNNKNDYILELPNELNKISLNNSTIDM